MSVLKRISAWLVIAASGALQAVSWITIALAQEAGDGDGADGDELATPILLGVAVLGIVAVLAFQRFFSKSRNSQGHPPREGSTSGTPTDAVCPTRSQPGRQRS